MEWTMGVLALTTKLSRGFIYVAYGHQFVTEAAESAKRVSEIHDLPCTLLTDKRPALEVQGSFEKIMELPFRMGYDDKLMMKMSPYDETIFLDTDTLVMHPIDGLFDLLKRFHLAVQFTPGGQHYRLPDVPPCFYEPSAGIIVWRKSSAVDKFFETWAERYKEVESAEGQQGAWDQRSLRWALWESDIRFCGIPAEFQLCGYKPEVCNDKVRMFHGRSPSAKLLQDLNAKKGLRVFIPKIGSVPIYYEAEIRHLILISLRFSFLALKQAIRRGLHHSFLWRFPVKKRPD